MTSLTLITFIKSVDAGTFMSLLGNRGNHQVQSFHKHQHNHPFSVAVPSIKGLPHYELNLKFIFENAEVIMDRVERIFYFTF